MREMPDKAFSLAIVDVPYGIQAADYSRGNTQHGNSLARCADYGRKDWDNAAPASNYFTELFRISSNQIIWGANHFISRFSLDSGCWIVWDKDNGTNGYADCELAWTSFIDKAVRKVRHKWHGMLQEDMSRKEQRIHPTQKPVALYKWLLTNYAKPRDTILDTHLGSQSSRIAAWDLGFDFVGYELDADYYKAGCERFERHRAQGTLFTSETASIEQEALPL
jgi:site-specific DNA-methyltransferase (adenine-specific)